MIIVSIVAMFLPSYVFAEFQLPEDPVKNNQTFTGCFEAAESGVFPIPNSNLRIVTSPLQDCIPGEIKIQFQANRIGELDPIGKVKIEGNGEGDVYQFSQYLLNLAPLNLRAERGLTPVNMELGPIVVLCDAGSNTGLQFNDAMLNGQRIAQLEITEMAVPGYGAGGSYPWLNVTLYNVKVDGIKKIYGVTQKEEIYLSYDRIFWALRWFSIGGGGEDTPEYYCTYNARNATTYNCDDFSESVTAIKQDNLNPIIPAWPDQFLLDYFEENFSNLTSTNTSMNNSTPEFSFYIEKDIDPSTIGNLAALLGGQIIDMFNIQFPDNPLIEHRNVSVESVEIRFNSKASVVENSDIPG